VVSRWRIVPSRSERAGLRGARASRTRKVSTTTCGRLGINTGMAATVGVEVVQKRKRHRQVAMTIGGLQEIKHGRGRRQCIVGHIGPEEAVLRLEAKPLGGHHLDGAHLGASHPEDVHPDENCEEAALLYGINHLRADLLIGIHIGESHLAENRPGVDL
jgi:hypothetical protein